MRLKKENEGNLGFFPKEEKNGKRGGEV